MPNLQALELRRMRGDWYDANTILAVDMIGLMLIEY